MFQTLIYTFQTLIRINQTLIYRMMAFWWLSVVIDFRSSKSSVFQLLTKLSRGTEFPDGTKKGQNLQKSSSALLPVLSNISNTAVCFYKGTHLSRIKRRNCRKSAVIHAFFLPFVPKLAILETPAAYLGENPLLML